MPGDPYSAAPPVRRYVTEVGAPPGRLRIGLRTTAPAEASPVDAACVAAAEHTARRLEALGHIVEPVSPGALDEGELLSTFLVIASTAVAHDLARIAGIVGRELAADDVEHLTWAYAEMAKGFTAADHEIAIATAHRWTRSVAEWWRPVDGTPGFDLLLTPTLAAPPPRIGEIDGDGDDPWQTLAAATPFAAFTLPFNVTGQPAVSLPLDWAEDGLPIGSQLVAATDREDLLIRVASQLESLPWKAPAAL